MRWWLIPVLMFFSTSSWAQVLPNKLVRKPLPDLNGDGLKETAIEDMALGASSTSTIVKIFSGGKLVLTLPDFFGNTADGYQVIGKRIAVWLGDWTSQTSQWQPHHYNFIWYRWGGRQKGYIVTKEGFTTKTYSFKQAKKLMPRLTANPGRSAILSRGPTFAQDAKVFAARKYRQATLKVTDITSRQSRTSYARQFIVDLVPSKDSSANLAIISLKHNGQIVSDTADL